MPILNRRPVGLPDRIEATVAAVSSEWLYRTIQHAQQSSISTHGECPGRSRFAASLLNLARGRLREKIGLLTVKAIDKTSFINENINVFEVLRYITREGKDIIDQWLDGLRDRKALLTILKRIARLEAGNFGDHKFCRDGVWELRIDVGPGYRLYYALSGKQVILLLCGGDKRTQSADINRASMYWQEAQTRMKGTGNETRLQKS